MTERKRNLGFTGKLPHSAMPVVVLSLLAGVPYSQAADPAVTSVRFWSLGDMTRIAVETNGPFQMRSDRIPNPDRVFYDLLGAHNQVGSGVGTHVIPVGDALVKQIRVAETQPSITRIVLDLDAPADVTASQLSNPDRLMIEIRPLGGSTSPSTIRSTTGVKKI